MPLAKQPGLDLNARNRWGKTPLHSVALERQLNIAILLIDGGANVIPLMTMAESRWMTQSKEGDDRLIRLLIDNGA